ncbi:MAG: hypothetical protein MJY93_05955 [Fibrobacter sp.]|nr:hypothetical protein [Fibrobacter sp.]
MNFHKVFNGAKIVAATAAVSLVLAACGDKGTSSENVEHGDSAKSSSSISKDDKSSDSKDEKSSDSKGDSSDSKDDSSSSAAVDVPKGARAATLDDLAKNMSLGEMFGTTVYLATGAQHGLFSLWVPDTAWVVASSDFEDGVLEINKKTGAIMGLSGPSVVDSMKNLLSEGVTLNFIVNEKEALQFSMDGGKTYNDVANASVKTTSAKMSQGDDLKGVRLTCKSGSTTNTYSFYEGRYYLETSTDDKVEAWSAGYYDIQRSYLLMLPKFFEGKTNALTSFFVNPDTYTLSFYGGVENSCDKSTFKYEDVAAKDLVNEWEAVDNGVEWVLEYSSNGAYTVYARKGGDTQQSKEGYWDIYGDVMFMHATGCKDPSNCTQDVMGVISELDPKTGFEFDHNDPDEPTMPKVWTLPQYE